MNNNEKELQIILTNARKLSNEVNESTLNKAGWCT